MNEPAIVVRGLTKRYGDKEVVRGVDFSISQGEVFAMLGPNGAGKTTIVEILEGHRSRTGGEVSVLGYDPARLDEAFKARIGVVLQETGVEPYLTVRELLGMYGGYFRTPLPVERVIELVGLTEQSATRVRKLSGGQQRRLDVAIGLAGDPELLFLDEPTTGFDPAARRDFWEMIKGLRDLGKTIFLTTHYMEEAEYLADRVVILRRGAIVADGPPSALAGDYQQTQISFRSPAGGAAILAGIDGIAIRDGVVSLRSATPTAMLFELTRRAQDAGLELEELRVNRPNLEDTYLSLVDEGASE